MDQLGTTQNNDQFNVAVLTAQIGQRRGKLAIADHRPDDRCFALAVDPGDHHLLGEGDRHRFGIKLLTGAFSAEAVALLTAAAGQPGVTEPWVAL